MWSKHLKEGISIEILAVQHQLEPWLIRSWRTIYIEHGASGLQPKAKGRPKTTFTSEMERLQYENAKLKLEIAQLKKTPKLSKGGCLVPVQVITRTAYESIRELSSELSINMLCNMAVCLQVGLLQMACSKGKTKSLAGGGAVAYEKNRGGSLHPTKLWLQACHGSTSQGWLVDK